MGVKERRTKILFTLMLFSGTELNSVNLNQSIQTAVDLSFNQKTRGTLSALIKEGLIQKSEDRSQKIEVNGETSGNSYSLTEKGFLALCLEFPFFRFLRQNWDGKWRVISYEIPESQREIRDRLRREMQGWGLGPWHRSFWLTPHPVIETLRELISQKPEEKLIQAFESDHILGDREILIEKVWMRSNLDKTYRELFKKWHTILSSTQEKPEKLRQVVNEYITILRHDPGLPPELLGQSWIGFEGYNIFKEIRSILLS